MQGFNWAVSRERIGGDYWGGDCSLSIRHTIPLSPWWVHSTVVSTSLSWMFIGESSFRNVTKLFRSLHIWWEAPESIIHFVTTAIDAVIAVAAILLAAILLATIFAVAATTLLASALAPVSPSDSHKTSQSDSIFPVASDAVACAAVAAFLRALPISSGLFRI